MERIKGILLTCLDESCVIRVAVTSQHVLCPVDSCTGEPSRVLIWRGVLIDYGMLDVVSGTAVKTIAQGGGRVGEWDRVVGEDVEPKQVNSSSREEIELMIIR